MKLVVLLSLVLVAFLSTKTYYFLLEAGYDIFPPHEDTHGALMAAVVYRSTGQPDVLSFETDVLRPMPFPHQVLVEVYAASLNPCDYKFRRNFIPSFVRPLPKIPGGDIAGVVVQVGSDVRSDIKVGDRIAALMPLLGSKWGGYAQYAVVNANFVAKIPSNVSFVQAAALPLVALTSLAAFDHIPLPYVDKKLLIHAGSGGVGSFAIQYAKHVLGISVVATTCSGRNEEFVKKLGADEVIDYTRLNFTSVVKDYDVVIDPMSYMYEDATLQPGVIKPMGQYFNIISSDFSLGADGIEKGNGLRTFLGPFLSQLGRKLGLKVLDYRTISVAPNGPILQRVFNEVEKGAISPIINKTFPLAEAAEAMRYLEKGRTTGKVVLIVKKEKKS